MYGLPTFLIDRLQNVQNAAACIITLTKKYDHIKPVLKQLHWLPVNQRINYKILLLAYKVLNGQGPVVQRLDNAIQQISVNKTNHTIRWIVIYPVDSVIQPLNNQGLAPSYITELLEPYTPAGNLSSSSKNLLKISLVKLVSYGHRCFSFAAPTLWNSLPDFIRQSSSLSSFKTYIKTYIFKKCFSLI